MNKELRIFALSILTIFIMLACTDKKNPVGTGGQQGPPPMETTIHSEYFSSVFSYEDSLRNYNSNNLVLGNYNSNGFDNQLVCLLKFSSLADTFYQEITNSKLILKTKNNHNFDVIDNTTLKIGKMNINWFESTAIWNEPTDSTSWTNGDFSFIDGNDFDLINDLNIMIENEDSLTIEIPNDLVEEWILEDSLNFGLALFTEEPNKFLEIYSSEYIENGPTLYFDYQETEEDTIVTVNRLAAHDIHIASTEQEFTLFQDHLIISNIQPIRMTMKFEIPPDIFAAADNYTTTIEDTALYMQRLTINSAKLILSFDNSTQEYPIETGMNIDPYIVTKDSIDTSQQPLLANEDIQDLYTASSHDSLKSDAFKINITNILQAYSSGTYENNGIMLRSLQEGNDLKHTEFFYDPADPDNPQNPKIEIIFTPPFPED